MAAMRIQTSNNSISFDHKVIHEKYIHMCARNSHIIRYFVNELNLHSISMAALASTCQPHDVHECEVSRSLSATRTLYLITYIDDNLLKNHKYHKYGQHKEDFLTTRLPIAIGEILLSSRFRSFSSLPFGYGGRCDAPLQRACVAIGPVTSTQWENKKCTLNAR